MIKLSRKQTAALDTLEDMDNHITEVIYGGSAGSGKSYVGCYWIIKNCLKYPGTRWGLGRTELKTLKRTTLKTFFEICDIQGLKSDVHYRYREQAGEIDFFNGSSVLLIDLAYLPSDPDFHRFGGYELTGAFCDEVAQSRHKAWTILKTRLRFKLNEYNLTPKMFGTLNPSTGWTYTYFYKPDKEKTLGEDKKFIQALPTDNSNLPESYLDVLRNLPKAERDRLYYGKWEAFDENQLISSNAIYDMFHNDFVNTQNYYITVDVARQGKDKSRIVVWKGLKVESIFSFDKNTIPELVAKVKELQSKYKIGVSNIIADESGVGGGFVDLMRCKGFLGGSKTLNNENYFNLRTQCFYYLAKYISDRKIWIPDDILSETEQELIKEELEQIKSAPTTDEGKLKIISKDEVKSNIGRSPDYSDALSMRLYFEINKNKGLYNLI